MLSINKPITLGDIKRLAEMADELQRIVEMAKMDLNQNITDDDEDGYRQNCVDIADEVENVWLTIGDWKNDVENNLE